MPVKARRSLKTLPRLPPSPFDRKIRHREGKPQRIKRHKSPTRRRAWASAAADQSCARLSDGAPAGTIGPQMAHAYLVSFPSLFFVPLLIDYCESSLQPASGAHQLWPGILGGEHVESFWRPPVHAPFVSFFFFLRHRASTFLNAPCSNQSITRVSGCPG